MPVELETIDIDQPFPHAEACLPTVPQTPSLIKSTYRPGEITVIVITRKKDLEKVRAHSRKYFDQGASQVLVVTGGRNPAEGRNCGAVNAAGEWLVFIDDDTDFNGDLSVVKGDWDWGSTYFKGAGADAAPTLALRNAVTGLLKDNLTSLPSFMAGYFTVGSFLFVRQTTFYKAGGFPAKWWRLEDNAIGAKLTSIGARYHHLSHKNPAVVHRWPRGILSMPEKYRNRRRLVYVDAGRAGRIVWVRDGDKYHLAMRAGRRVGAHVQRAVETTPIYSIGQESPGF